MLQLLLFSVVRRRVQKLRKRKGKRKVGKLLTTATEKTNFGGEKKPLNLYFGSSLTQDCWHKLQLDEIYRIKGKFFYILSKKIIFGTFPMRKSVVFLSFFLLLRFLPTRHHHHLLLLPFPHICRSKKGREIVSTLILLLLRPAEEQESPNCYQTWDKNMNSLVF